MAMAKKKDQDVLLYRGRPLLRCGKVLYYGSMNDKHIVMMQILESKKVKDLEVASKVSVTMMLTDEKLSPKERIVKNSEKGGIYSAIDIADVWLERTVSGK